MNSTNNLTIERSNQLRELGMIFDGKEFAYSDVNVHWTEIATMGAHEWKALIASITQVIADRKEEEHISNILVTNLYRDLATIQAQRKVLEAQEAQIKLQIIEGMEASGELQVVTDYGKATISHRTSYTYTEAVEKLNEKLKLAKVKEEQTGKAKAKETTYLTFTPNSK